MDKQEILNAIKEADRQLGMFREGLKMPQYKHSHLAEIRDRLMAMHKIIVLNGIKEKV